MALLTVEDLVVRFRTHGSVVHAVNGVSFELAPGETLGLVGESGCGKSVTSLAMMGLLPKPAGRVEGGSVMFDGLDLVTLSERDLRDLRGREIAMIFQDPMTAMTPVYTIGWQIAEQIMTHEKIGKRAALARAVDLLAEVNIPKPKEAIHRYPHQLSGGMRQRAVIAMALSCNPALLIADEPTTALDVTVQAQILDLIRKLRRDHKSAVVFITHDMGVIAEMADRVMVMYSGRIVERGTKSEILLEPHHPYTRALLDSIPPLEGDKPRRLRSIPGSPPSLFNLPKGCSFAPRCPSRFERCAERPALEGGAHAAACFLKAAS
jgi:peptide/nickel transport system ATP-binding protein